MYRASFIILCYDQQTHNYFTNYHTPTCFDTILSSPGSLYNQNFAKLQVFQMQLNLKYLCNLARYCLQAP